MISHDENRRFVHEEREKGNMNGRKTDMEWAIGNIGYKFKLILSQPLVF
jgi:hypothetical protein